MSAAVHKLLHSAQTGTCAVVVSLEALKANSSSVAKPPRQILTSLKGGGLTAVYNVTVCDPTTFRKMLGENFVP